MGNCIISKLGGSVDNDNLLQLGDVRLVVKAMSETYASQPNAHKFTLRFFSLEGEPSMEIVGDGYFTDSTMTQNLGKNIVIEDGSGTALPYYVSDGNYEIIIHTRYCMLSFENSAYSNSQSAISLDCDTIRCKIGGTGNNRRISSYGIDNLVGNVKNIFDNPIAGFTQYRDETHTFELAWLESSQCKDTFREINTSGVKVIGSLTDINNLPSLVSCMIISLKTYTNPNENTITGDLADINPYNINNFVTLHLRACVLVTGDISSIAKLYKLTSLNLERSSQLTGNLETFLDAVHANGRTSGKMTIDISSTAIKYNNAALSGQKTVTFSASGWTLA